MDVCGNIQLFLSFNEARLLLNALNSFNNLPNSTNPLTIQSLREHLLQVTVEAGSPPTPRSLFPSHSSVHEAVQVLRNGPPCPQNGKSLRACQQWKATRTLASASNRSACSLVSALAVATFNSTTHNPGSWADFIQQMLCGNNGRLLGDESIESIVFRCGAIADKQVVGNFIAMISFIQLAFKCQRYDLFNPVLFNKC
jgi:hypothetical protein